MPFWLEVFLLVSGGVLSALFGTVFCVTFIQRTARAYESKQLAHRYRMAEMEAEHALRLTEVRTRVAAVQRALTEDE